MNAIRLLVAVVLCASAVAAQAAKLSPAQLLDTARAAIIAGQLGKAERLLAEVDADLVDRNELDFLRGTVALAEHDYDRAIAAFHAILERDPSLNRVRLDLARTFFEKGDDEAAEHHFRIAEAAGLPPAVQANVNAFLDAIRRRKRWGATLTFGLASDTNANVATSAKAVTIFGLPFELNPNARQHSSVGLATGVGGSYQYDLGTDSRLVLGANDNEVDYTDHRFDDRTISGLTGVRFLLGNDAEVTVAAVANRRWFGEVPLNWGRGGRIESQMSVTPHLLLGGAIEGQDVTYDRFRALNGPRLSFSVSATYGLDAISSIKLDAAVLREQTTDATFSNFQYLASLTYFRVLPLGFAVNVGVNPDLARYDTVMAGFGKTLHYDSLAWKIGLSNRYLDIFGFTPVVTYIHTDQFANVPLYSYDRDRVQIGMTRNF